MPPHERNQSPAHGKPQYFEGAHDDIEQFLGDCQTYFKNLPMILHAASCAHDSIRLLLIQGSSARLVDAPP